MLWTVSPLALLVEAMLDTWWLKDKCQVYHLCSTTTPTSLQMDQVPLSSKGPLETLVWLLWWGASLTSVLLLSFSYPECSWSHGSVWPWVWSVWAGSSFCLDPPHSGLSGQGFNRIILLRLARSWWHTFSSLGSNKDSASVWWGGILICRFYHGDTMIIQTKMSIYMGDTHLLKMESKAVKRKDDLLRVWSSVWWWTWLHWKALGSVLITKRKILKCQLPLSL